MEKSPPPPTPPLAPPRPPPQRDIYSPSKMEIDSARYHNSTDFENQQNFQGSSNGLQKMKIELVKASQRDEVFKKVIQEKEAELANLRTKTGEMGAWGVEVVIGYLCNDIHALKAEELKNAFSIQDMQKRITKLEVEDLREKLNWTTSKLKEVEAEKNQVKSDARITQEEFEEEKLRWEEKKNQLEAEWKEKQKELEQKEKQLASEKLEFEINSREMLVEFDVEEIQKLVAEMKNLESQNEYVPGEKTISVFLVEDKIRPAQNTRGIPWDSMEEVDEYKKKVNKLEKKVSNLQNENENLINALDEEKEEGEANLSLQKYATDLYHKYQEKDESMNKMAFDFKVVLKKIKKVKKENAGGEKKLYYFNMDDELHNVTKLWKRKLFPKRRGNGTLPRNGIPLTLSFSRSRDDENDENQEMGENPDDMELPES